MKWKKWSGVLLAALCLVGCSSETVEQEKPEYAVGVVLKAINSPYWLDLKSGMENAAENYGIDLTLTYPSGEREDEEQNDLIDDMLHRDIDALLVAPCNSYDTQWFMNRAKQKNIITLAVDTKALDVDLPYIGTDNQQVGLLASEYFTQELQNGSLLILGGQGNQSSNAERVQTIKDSMSDAFDITVRYTELTEEEGYNAVMKLTKPVNGIFCTNSVVGLGAAAALKERGWTAKIIAVDTEDDAVQILDSGVMDAIICQNGYEIGYQAIEIIRQALEQDSQPKDVLFDVKLTTQEGDT